MAVEEVLGKLTIDEKARLVMGADSWRTSNIERLGIPSIRMADGPHGLRKQSESNENNIDLNNSIPATCFPPASLTSCSFDRDLIYRMGEAIADEAVLQGVDILLGPAVNIKRSPLCGRNFEYVSEDPYLAGEYAVSFINGVQSRGIGTSIKHFAVNNQETLRMNIDANVDERALHEIYLYAFEKAVKKAGPYTIMASYNRINGDYGCENSYLLKKLLREEWGFDGLVVSDWSAINDRLKSILSGCDLEMPNSGPERTQRLIKSVNDGKLDISVLDEAAANVLRLVDRCRSSKKIKKENIYDINNDLARKIAEESMVLLKNEGNILPLNPDKNYALIGEFASAPRFQGGGSSHITPTHLISIKDVFERNKVKYTYSPGYMINSEKINSKLISQAAQNAAGADFALVFIGLTDIYEYEGLDRKNMSLPPSHIRLLEEVYKANKNVVVVLCCGSAVSMEWEPMCRGILYAGVMGQSGSEAIYNILFGKVNPSGKLSETFPIKLSDTPCYNSFPGGNNSVHYLESIYVGYRYYTTAQVPVKYPFGFGLSYTSFEFSGLEADRQEVNEGCSLKLKLKVRNTGSMDGAEVVQIYIKNNSRNTFTPDIVLKNFEKVFLKAGTGTEVVFTINYEDFMRYDPIDGWVADTGDYQVFAAECSTDIRQGIHIRVLGKGKRQSMQGLDTYYHPHNNIFNEAEFENLYQRAPSPIDIEHKAVSMNTPLKFCTKTLMGKLLTQLGKLTIYQSNHGEGAYAARKALTWSLGDTPIRSMVVMNEGTDLATGEALVKMMTGRFFSGLKDVVKSIYKQKE